MRKAELENIILEAYQEVIQESLLDQLNEEEPEEEPTPEEEPDMDAPQDTVLEDATDKILGKFPTLKIALIKELKRTEWVEVDLSKNDDKSQASIQ